MDDIELWRGLHVAGYEKAWTWSHFMQAFETAKRHFGHRDGLKLQYEIEPLDMEMEAPSVYYDEAEQCVKIPR